MTHGHVEHVYIWVCLFVQLVFKYVVLYVWVYIQYFLYTYGYIYIFNEPCSEISGLVSDHKNSLTHSNPERESRSSIGIWFVGTNVHSSNNGIYFLYKAGPPSYKMFQLQIYPHTISMNRSIFLLDD